MTLKTERQQDFMLIAQATDGDEKFHTRVKHALDIAAAVHPEIAWRADVDCGFSRLVGVFSAPDLGVARKVARLVGALRSVKAELALVRSC